MCLALLRHVDVLQGKAGCFQESHRLRPVPKTLLSFGSRKLTEVPRYITLNSDPRKRPQSLHAYVQNTVA